MEHFTICPHCQNKHLHYPFCQDLGTKSIIDIPWPENINFALFKVKQVADTGGGRTIPDTEIFIPGFYEVQKVGQDFWSVLTEKEYQTFIAPADYYADRNLFYVREKQLFIPNEVFQHPHLPVHATFQFYFLNNSLFTANLPYLDIGDFENNGSQQIRVHWTIRVTPSGTYVFFRSEYIFFAWKIEVRQGIVNMNLLKVSIDGVSKMISGGVKAVGKFFGIDATESQEAQKDLAQNLVGRDRGSDFMEREKINRIQEQHTARMFQSTLSHTGDQAVEPAIFYANTVKFPYNLFDYWLRNDKEPFACRIHYSNNLLNNLIHNNNINPITYPLDITFEKLGNIIRVGYWKGELVLDFDTNGRMAEYFARGVTFYKDKKEHFVNPNLGVKEAPRQNWYVETGGDSYTAQAITDNDEPWENNITRSKGSNFHQRAHFFIFYEDGSKDHWLVLFPQSFQDSDLAQGHTHGGFQITFDKPVLKMIDVYTCIGCGAHSNQGFGGATIKGFLDLHSAYDGGQDSLDTIHKGLPFDPWYNKMTSASIQGGYWMTADKERCLGSPGDVWEFTGQYIVGKDNKPFTKAYGFIPTGGTIQWTTKGQGSSKIVWQKVPGHDDFSALDWSPPPGSGGDIEIPLEDPEINIPEPGENDFVPEDDFTPDPYDISGGEVEIPPIEPDLPFDIDPGVDVDNTQDIDPPPIDVDPPQDLDTSQDQDNSQDTGDQDQGDDDPPNEPDPGDDDDGD